MLPPKCDFLIHLWGKNNTKEVWLFLCAKKKSDLADSNHRPCDLQSFLGNFRFGKVGQNPGEGPTARGRPLTAWDYCPGPTSEAALRDAKPCSESPSVNMGLVASKP